MRKRRWDSKLPALPQKVGYRLRKLYEGDKLLELFGQLNVQIDGAAATLTYKRSPLQPIFEACPGYPANDEEAGRLILNLFEWHRIRYGESAADNGYPEMSSWHNRAMDEHYGGMPGKGRLYKPLPDGRTVFALYKVTAESD